MATKFAVDGPGGTNFGVTIGGMTVHTWNKTRVHSHVKIFTHRVSSTTLIDW